MGLFDQYLSLLCCAVLSCLVAVLFTTPWTAACQASLSMGICWRGLPCPPPRNLSNPGIPHYRQILYHLCHHGSPLSLLLDCKYKERKHIQFFSLFNFQHLRQFLARSRPSLNISRMSALIFDFMIINSVVVSLPNWSPSTTPFCFFKQSFQPLIPQALEIIVKTPSFWTIMLCFLYC